MGLQRRRAAAAAAAAAAAGQSSTPSTAPGPSAESAIGSLLQGPLQSRLPGTDAPNIYGTAEAITSAQKPSVPDAGTMPLPQPGLASPSISDADQV